MKSELVKPGIQTTEFWLTLLGDAAALITILLHKDVAQYVPMGAVVAAGVSHIVYVIKRSQHKTNALSVTAMLLSEAEKVAQLESTQSHKSEPSPKLSKRVQEQ